MDVNYATVNNGKAFLLRRELEGTDIRPLVDGKAYIDLERDDPRVLAEHRIKLAYGHRGICMPTLAMNAGFFQSSNPQRGERLLDRLYEVHKLHDMRGAKKGPASFIEVMAFIDSFMKFPLLFQHEVKGRIDLDRIAAGANLADLPVQDYFMPDGTNVPLSAFSVQGYADLSQVNGGRPTTKQFAEWAIKERSGQYVYFE
jgi:hypothetical protein